MLGICFLAFCLGQGSPEPSGRATFTHDIRNPSRTEQIVAYDNRWVVAGFVHQSAGDDAAFIGTLPLTVSMLGGRSMAAPSSRPRPCRERARTQTSWPGSSCA
jgi:hypothetical protein